MTFESELSRAALAAFAEPCVLNATAVDLLIDRSVEYVDENGNVRQIAALVHAYKADLPAWDSGDSVTADSGNVQLMQIVYDDSHIVRIEARPIT